MEIGWQHQRRRREPITGKEGQPWDKAKLKRQRGKDTRAGKGHHRATAAPFPLAVERYFHARNVYM